MMTSIFSSGTPNNQWASMISKPLFINVAESIVILFPIFQLGWFSACSTVMDANVSLGVLSSGPPEAVRMILLALFRSSPARHCRIALCSLSIGTRWTPYSLTNEVTSSPATTSVSLFASAMCFLCLIASMVGFNPANPTIELMTRSTSSLRTISINPSRPARTSTESPTSDCNAAAFISSNTTTPRGWNCAIWFCSSSMFVFVVR